MGESSKDPISKRECEKTIVDLRIHFGIEEFRVLAYAEVKIGDEEDELVAVSGHDSPIGTVGMPQTPIFSPQSIGFLRDADAEYNLLEEIGRRLLTRGSRLKGNHTNRYRGKAVRVLRRSHQ